MFISARISLGGTKSLSSIWSKVSLLAQEKKRFTMSSDDRGADSIQKSKKLYNKTPFNAMLICYGVIMGCQCAIVSLLAQILIPPFGDRIDETYIGSLGFMMLFAGVPASIAVGCYLDRTLQYRYVCNVLFWITLASVLGLYIATELRSLLGVVICW